MIKSNGYSDFLVPTTGGGINGVGWEFSPEYHKRKTPANVYLNRHHRKKMNKLCSNKVTYQFQYNLLRSGTS